jgi:hypothetical protein
LAKKKISLHAPVVRKEDLDGTIGIMETLERQKDSKIAGALLKLMRWEGAILRGVESEANINKTLEKMTLELEPDNEEE